MRLEDYLECAEPDIIRMKGHRIFLEDVLNRWLRGESAEEIAKALPTLALEEVYGAVTYYLHNTSVIDEYLERARRLAEDQRRAADAQPDAVALRLRALKQRRAEEARAGV